MTLAPVELPITEATTYAEWFACLAESTRVRLLHTVATAPGGVTVGELTEALGISQSTCSHHVRKLADVGFVRLRREKTATIVTINAACCTGFPQAADAVMGLLAPRPCCPSGLPADITVRAMTDHDWDDVLRIYSEGIDTHWLPGHRWVALLDDEVVGWTAAAPVSTKDHYAGVAETSVYVDAQYRGRGVGKALLHKQVTAADRDGLWTLQTTVFTENRPGIALHHAAGYRTVGVRERIAERDGTWHDIVLLERRTDAVQR
ncbi:helix-turn-helix domain-containing GNAT family N-acetyltransferase [Amycolatopsis magusensis]|uniref:L-amino acid N-acyltransferase YncA n=1 Tax=Amycolatopsis magusensis TaxID=882444 RepID=A0ABS4PXW8_9PSEU|nr:metalloregulator ArsR/SmtB family transcription factor [Amycolatopsis magusensis]MBP2184272.1 L-amino acid N-acyltransferase YncA [Amycolatopsis magusensis]